MYGSSYAAAGYQKSAQSVGAPQSVEYQAFQRVNAGLRAAMKDGAGHEKLAAAVHANTKLWTVLAVDLASDENQLSDKLRAQLIGLAQYSIKQGLRIMSGEETAETLITINGAVMGGLSAALSNKAA